MARKLRITLTAEISDEWPNSKLMEGAALTIVCDEEKQDAILEFLVSDIPDPLRLSLFDDMDWDMEVFEE